MSWDLGEATEAEVDEIMRTPSAITASEVENAGVTFAHALRTLKGFMRQGSADVLFLAGSPAALLGHMPHPFTPERRMFWFIASQAFFDLGLKGVRYTKGYLDRLRKEQPGVAFESFTYSTHPATGRWFQVIGFEEGVSPLPAVRRFILGG